MTELPPRLVLFDGVCGLCDRTVQFLLDHDPDGALSYAALQGETAAAIRARHPELEGVDSVVFVEREGGEAGAPALERVTVRSKAVMRMLRHVRGPYRHLAVLGALPAPLLDVGYDLVASARYRIFGKLETCRVPDAKVRGRFLA
jgi:predicted DCC family thiol-disulfide oxidoreductase YuxK